MQNSSTIVRRMKTSTNQPILIQLTTACHRTKALSKALLLITAAMISPGISSAGALSATEQAIATELADRVGWSAAKSPQPGQTLNQGKSHPLAVQTLSVERQELKNRRDNPRVSVYQYHYANAAARLLVFDLSTNTLIRESAISSVHLPLNTQEIAFAKKLLEQRSDIIGLLRQEQQRRGEPAFDNLDELDVKASIFEPFDTSHPCAIERCALFSLFDQTRTVFATEPIVRLQTLNVGTLARR